MPKVGSLARLRPFAVVTLAVLLLAAGSGDATAQSAVLRKVTVPTATVGQPYSYDLARVLECQTNASPVWVFTWQNPAPVPGIGFAASGLIAGTPTAAGSYALAYQVTDASGSPGACIDVTTDTGTLTVIGAATSGIVPVSGNNQVVAPGTPIPQPLAARVVDSQGNGVPGVSVTWSAGSAGGTVTNPVLVSNAQGLVQAGFTTGPGAQNWTVTVAAAGAGASFQFTVQNQRSAVDAPAQQVATPAAVTAVTTPTIQLNNIRQRLDQIRAQRSPAVTQALKVRVGGQALPPSSAFALAPSTDRGGRPSTGGGASADAAGGSGNAMAGKAGTGGGAAADKPGDAYARWGLYLNGDIDIGKQSAVDTQSAFKLTSNGLTLGSDYRFEGNHVLGAAVGFLKADTDVADGGSQDAKGYSFSLYGTWVPAENAYVDGILNAGRNDYDSQRPLQGGGTATSSTDGNQFAVAVSAGWSINNGQWTANPYLRAEYVDAKVKGFTETGTAGEALAIGEQRVKATTLTVGGQASYAISTSWGVLLPYGRLELQYLAQSNAQDVTAQVVGLTAPASIVPTLGQDKTFGNFAAGASAILPHGFSAFFNYEQLFGKDNYEDQRYTLGLRIEF